MRGEGNEESRYSERQESEKRVKPSLRQFSNIIIINRFIHCGMYGDIIEGATGVSHAFS